MLDDILLVIHHALPFILLSIVLLALRTDIPSLYNWIIVVLGALATWLSTPTNTRWGMTIRFGLLFLAIILSPLQRFFFGSKGSSHNQNEKFINILHDPPDAECDIVAVHGLGSSVETTWKHPDSGKVWLRDLLHQDLPKARIMTFRHNSKWKSDAQVKDIIDYGKQLLSAVEDERVKDDVKDRPIVLIGHSFGGLLIEQALVIAKRPSRDRDIEKQHSNLFKSLAGTVFLGTPHAGSGYTALGKLYCHLTYWRGSSTVLLSAIDPDSDATRNLEDEFLSGYPELPMADFYEAYPNTILGQRVLVVKKKSATRAGYMSESLDTDHFGLNKYRDQDDASYIRVRNEMNRMLKLKMNENQRETDEEEGKYLDVLRRLDWLDFESTKEEYRDKFIDGTCGWIAKEKQFEEWDLKEKNKEEKGERKKGSGKKEKKVLWIFGKPGSGKTFIAHYICEYLKDKGFLMYFFFDSKGAESKERQSLAKFYHTILRQLLQLLRHSNRKLKTECFEIVRQKILTDDLNQETLQELLQQVLTRVGPTFLVIDALDECRKENDPGKLQTWLANEKKHPGLRTLITSRPEQRITDVAENSLFIHLELNSLVAKSNNDIRLFIQARLVSSKDLQGDGPEWKEVKQKIEHRLMERADGMILYTSLMLQILEDKAGDFEDLVAELERLPPNIGKLYEDRLGQIKNVDFAKRIFQWLVTCRRPLTVDALRGANTINKTIQREKSFELQGKDLPLGMDQDRFRRFLLKDCLPLIEILKDDTVRLVHTTVSQYLLGENMGEEDASSTTGPPPRFHVHLKQSHEQIALTCLTYLRVVVGDIDASHNRSLSGNPNLREYAVLEWSEHSQRSEEEIMAQQKKRKVLVSFCKEWAFTAWLDDRARMDNRFCVHFSLERTSITNIGTGCPARRYPTPLHIAAYFNLYLLSRKFLDQVNISDATESTPLHIAAGLDHAIIVHDLLKAGARTDMQDSNGSFALHRAVRRGHIGALKELIIGNADVNAKDKYKFTPLHVACQLGWTECVKMLLDHGAKVPTESDAVETPLGFAIANGHFGVVRVLLNGDKSLISFCGKPLVQAARKGKSDMVKFLLENGADISHTDFMGQTALHKACISGHMDLVEYLLNYPKVTVDPVDQSERTPLYFAAERGYLDIVNLLIKHDANVNYLDRRWETAMFKPAGNGHTAVVSRLLDVGTNPTKLDMWDRTPLRFAAMRGRKDIVRMLLERTKIDQNKPDWMGRPVLHAGAAYLRQGQEEVIDILFEHGAQPATQGYEGGSALHAAISRESDQPPVTKDLVEKLIHYGVPIDTVDEHGKTPLALAVQSENLEVVEHLLKSGASPGNTALHCAIETGNIVVVKLLLCYQSNLDLTERNLSGETALHIAAKEGDEAILKELLNAKIATRLLDMEGMTALMRAEKLEKEGLVSLLQNADPAPAGDYETRAASGLWGRRAIHWAAEDGKDVKIYMTDDETLNSKDDVGRTALHLATLLGCLMVVQQLLSAKADVDLTEELGQTPLHYAAENGNMEIMEALISAEADINAQDKWFRSPLHLAVQKGHSETASRLISADAQIQSDYQQQTVFHIAAMHGHENIMSSLLESNPIPLNVYQQDHAGKTALHYASEHGNTAIVTALLPYFEESSMIDIKDDLKQTALHLASKNGYIDIVRRLIKSGSIVYRTSEDRDMALHFAAESDHLETVAELLDALPDHVERCLNKWDEKHPQWPSEEEGYDQAFFEALINVGALVQNPETRKWQVNPEEWLPTARQTLKSKIISDLQGWDKSEHSIATTAINRAVKSGHVSIVKFLLKTIPGTPPETPDYFGFDPLQRAAHLGLTEIASHLLAAGATINAISDSQQTCLHLAATNGHAETIDLLLENGANADLARYRDGRTALHLAAEKGHTGAVKALIRMAFLNARDDLDKTPLHLACENGEEGVVDLLLDVDADVLVGDVERKTPLAVASERGFGRILEKLEVVATRQKLRMAEVGK
ncbi:MAG: hypothetical protein M1834_001621 [Cirrosporium novae-zelandiae]|nr:MAG: hypothetical protein M1834_004138 [Cirrosporium novae-zelandiae]KAI9735605.1 MAG: hypothetical protein M1834_001621 [Cirrosporium novae-zelandiae]